MLIYSHCPVEPHWQLLKPAVSQSHFDQLPLVKSFFFDVGMRFLGHDRGILCTRRGVVTINLGFSRPDAAAAAFTFRLTYGNTAVSRIHVSTSSSDIVKL